MIVMTTELNSIAPKAEAGRRGVEGDCAQISEAFDVAGAVADR